jgi:hypothetical protein
MKTKVIDENFAVMINAFTHGIAVATPFGSIAFTVSFPYPKWSQSN